MGARFVVVALLVASLVAPAAAFAAPRKPVEAPIPVAAQKDYDLARAFFRAGDFMGCVEALERAQKVAPDPRFFWNSAACEKKLGHHARAIRFVERYITAGGSSLSEQAKKEANAFLDAARAYVARVTITANVEGVEVSIDGELVGTTPLGRAVVVDEGEHVVRYVRSGWKTVEAREKALGGVALTWAMELVPEVPDPIAKPSPSPPMPTAPPLNSVVSPAASEAAQGGRDAHRSPPSRVGPTLLGSAGLLASGFGGVFVGTTLAEARALEDECGSRCDPSRWEGARDRQVLGSVLLSVGGAVLLSAALWWMLTPARAF